MLIFVVDLQEAAKSVFIQADFTITNEWLAETALPSNYYYRYANSTRTRTYLGVYVIQAILAHRHHSRIHAEIFV